MQETMYESFPIARLPQRERFDYFQAVVDRVFCPMQVQPIGASRDAFRGGVETATLGSLRLANVATSACSVRRSGGDVGRQAEAPYLVKFQLKGESLWTQRNRALHLRAGDFVIASMAEPYSLVFRDDFEMPVLALGAATMRRLTPDPDRFLGVRMSGEDADCGLLSSFVAQVVARMSRLREPMVRRLEANILDLLGGVLSARLADRGPTPAEQLAQIKAYIAEHLHDRRLGPAMIASAFAVSTRYVHALFEPEPLTVGRYIRRLRVAACRRLLVGGAGRSLTDIALDCGFYDLSHMTRCFRDEFGVTPREVRLLAQDG